MHFCPSTVEKAVIVLHKNDNYCKGHAIKNRQINENNVENASGKKVLHYVVSDPRQLFNAKNLKLSMSWVSEG